MVVPNASSTSSPVRFGMVRNTSARKYGSTMALKASSTSCTANPAAFLPSSSRSTGSSPLANKNGRRWYPPSVSRMALMSGFNDCAPRSSGICGASPPVALAGACAGCAAVWAAAAAAASLPSACSSSRLSASSSCPPSAAVTRPGALPASATPTPPSA